MLILETQCHDWNFDECIQARKNTRLRLMYAMDSRGLIHSRSPVSPHINIGDAVDALHFLIPPEILSLPRCHLSIQHP